MFMKKAKKIIGVTALSAGLLFTSLPSVTQAANTGDTIFGHTFTSNSTNYTTSSRAKENSTSSYVKINETPAYYVYVDIQGFRPSSTTGTNYWANETIGGKQAASVGAWRVKQNVYENGGRSAKLKLSRYSVNGKVSGKWSPDSVGSAPHLN